jgi:hypothetical protein
MFKSFIGKFVSLFIPTLIKWASGKLSEVMKPKIKKD